MAQEPIKTASGTVRINDSRIFPVNTTTAAALVEVNPGGLRELHWHPNGDEWLYVIEGQARMGVFAGQGQARTFDLQAGDVGYVPIAMGHYLENTGTTQIAIPRNIQEPVLHRSLARHMDGIDAAKTGAGASQPGSRVMDALRKTKALVVPE